MMHTRPTHTPGGAQRDRQHPSWPESREAGEGGWGGQHIYPPSTLNHTHTHTPMDTHLPASFCALGPKTHYSIST